MKKIQHFIKSHVINKIITERWQSICFKYKTLKLRAYKLLAKVLYCKQIQQILTYYILPYTKFYDGTQIFTVQLVHQQTKRYNYINYTYLNYTNLLANRHKINLLSLFLLSSSFQDLIKILETELEIIYLVSVNIYTYMLIVQVCVNLFHKLQVPTFIIILFSFYLLPRSKEKFKVKPPNRLPSGDRNFLPINQLIFFNTLYLYDILFLCVNVSNTTYLV